MVFGIHSFFKEVYSVLYAEIGFFREEKKVLLLAKHNKGTVLTKINKTNQTGKTSKVLFKPIKSKLNSFKLLQYTIIYKKLLYYYNPFRYTFLKVNASRAGIRVLIFYFKFNK